jgi:hypothetical protein
LKHVCSIGWGTYRGGFFDAYSPYIRESG